jgi:hypothetical protein
MFRVRHTVTASRLTKKGYDDTSLAGSGFAAPCLFFQGLKARFVASVFGRLLIGQHEPRPASFAELKAP